MPTTKPHMIQAQHYTRPHPLTPIYLHRILAQHKTLLPPLKHPHRSVPRHINCIVQPVTPDTVRKTSPACTPSSRSNKSNKINAFLPSCSQYYYHHVNDFYGIYIYIYVYVCVCLYLYTDVVVVLQCLHIYQYINTYMCYITCLNIFRRVMLLHYVFPGDNSTESYFKLCTNTAYNCLY